MNNRKKYFRKLIGSLLLVVFLLCSLLPVSSSSFSFGKTKILQKESKAKAEQNSFVSEEELDEDGDDNFELAFANVFHFYVDSFRSLSPIRNITFSQIKFDFVESLPLFLSTRTIKI